MASRALVLDANILIRAVLGNRVRGILEKYADNVSFFVPEYAYAEAEEHLVALITKRGGDPAKGADHAEGRGRSRRFSHHGPLRRLRGGGAEAARQSRP